MWSQAAEILNPYDSAKESSSTEKKEASSKN